MMNRTVALLLSFIIIECNAYNGKKCHELDLGELVNIRIFSANEPSTSDGGINTIVYASKDDEVLTKIAMSDMIIWNGLETDEHCVDIWVHTTNGTPKFIDLYVKKGHIQRSIRYFVYEDNAWRSTDYSTYNEAIENSQIVDEFDDSEILQSSLNDDTPRRYLNVRNDVEEASNFWEYIFCLVSCID